MDLSFAFQLINDRGWHSHPTIVISKLSVSSVQSLVTVNYSDHDPSDAKCDLSCIVQPHEHKGCLIKASVVMFKYVKEVMPNDRLRMMGMTAAELVKRAPVPPALLAKIQAAAMKSPFVSPRLKKLIGLSMTPPQAPPTRP